MTTTRVHAAGVSSKQRKRRPSSESPEAEARAARRRALLVLSTGRVPAQLPWPAQESEAAAWARSMTTANTALACAWRKAIASQHR